MVITTSTVLWALAGLLGYLQVGNLVGRISWHVWNRKKSNGLLPLLLYPLTAIEGAVGSSAKLEISGCENKDKYLIINSWFWALRLAWNLGVLGVMLIGFLIKNAVLQPMELAAFLGQLITGHRPIRPLGRAIAALGIRIRKRVSLPAVDAEDQYRLQLAAAAEEAATLENQRTAIEERLEALRREHPPLEDVIGTTS